MNIPVNLVLWCVLVITKQCITEEESKCVQRRLGACKTLTKLIELYLEEFHSPPPDGFLLKTSMEFNLLDNKHNFENNLPVEKKRPVRYNLDNPVLVTIQIRTNGGDIRISLGKKYYRLAELKYINDKPKFYDSIYNRYTPSLPTFPYNLYLEIRTNGTFSIYAEGNTEPFFECQLPEPFHVKYISFWTEGYDDDIIAFVDCSVNKPNCGSQRIDRLFGCREWLVGLAATIENFEGFQKTYGEGVLFDEYIVVDTEYSSKVVFNYEHNALLIDFRINSIVVGLATSDHKAIKGVQTEQWFEAPESPYAVRVLLTTGENNNFLNITNLRNNTILSLNLCKDVGGLRRLVLVGPKLYFDCLIDDRIMSERPRKTNETDSWGSLLYNENGYNYSKTFLDTTDFVSKPFVMYEYEFGNSTQDWCPDEPKPEVLVTSKYNDDSLEGIIERSKTELHADLQKINAQNNATSDINAAVLTELKKVSAKLEKINVQNDAAADSNTALLTELKVISNSNQAILDQLGTHLGQNTTTVNNYYNQLNVTELLKFFKQN